MKKFTIAIGSNDSENIVQSHMGEAGHFCVYTVFADGSTKFVERRENSSPDEEGEHGASQKMKAVLQIIKDCQVVVARQLSPNFKNIAAKTAIQPVVVRFDKIEKILEQLSGKFAEIFALVERKSSGEKVAEILETG